jgi:hypothetical protein
MAIDLVDSRRRGADLECHPRAGNRVLWIAQQLTRQTLSLDPLHEEA